MGVNETEHPDSTCPVYRVRHRIQKSAPWERRLFRITGPGSDVRAPKKRHGTPALVAPRDCRAEDAAENSGILATPSPVVNAQTQLEPMLFANCYDLLQTRP